MALSFAFTTESQASSICKNSLVAKTTFTQFISDRTRLSDEHPIVVGKKYSTLASGAQMYLLERKASQWEIKVRVKNNSHGDPRQVSRVLGRDLAEFFGHKRIADNLLQVPGAKAINEQSETLSSYLKKGNEIPIRFYTDNGIAENKDMVLNYVNSLTYPMSEDGFFQIHDVSYHHLSVLFPPTLAKLSKTYFGFMSVFAKYLKTKSPKIYKDSNLDSLIFEMLAIRVDKLGFLHLVHTERTPDNKLYNLFVKHFYGLFLFGGVSRAQALKNFWEQDIKDRVPQAVYDAGKDYIEDFISSIPHSNQKIQLSLEDTFRLIDLRKIELEKALSRYNDQ